MSAPPELLYTYAEGSGLLLFTYLCLAVPIVWMLKDAYEATPRRLGRIAMSLILLLMMCLHLFASMALNRTHTVTLTSPGLVEVVSATSGDEPPAVRQLPLSALSCQVVVREECDDEAPFLCERYFHARLTHQGSPLSPGGFAEVDSFEEAALPCQRLGLKAVRVLP